MMKRTNQSLKAIMAAIMLIAAMIVPAYATASIEEQMAANSAAWHIANEAGDTATCEALHAANVALAEQAAGANGSASYNSASGTWDITTNDGGNISSSGSYSGGRSDTITYTSTSSSGDISSISGSAFTSSAINSYMENGGTHSGLVDAYNNAAYNISSTGNYGSSAQTTSAAEETAVMKELYGMSDSEAARYQANLEASKQNYANAQDAYDAAIAAGDAAGAAAAQAQMDAAHQAAESTRSQYSYSGDSYGYSDGGYINPIYNTGASSYEGNDYYGTPSYGSGYDDYYSSHTPGYDDYYSGYTPSDSTSYPSYSPGYDDYYSSYDPYYPSTNNYYYSITASAGSGGSISPSGTSSVSYGSSKSYTITPNTGYKISSVTVDGSNVGAVSSYTFSSVTSNHTISVSFAKKSYSISASAGTGGSISPSGTSTVTYGGSQSYSITPNEGYEIQSVVVDGTNVGKASTYTFSNVKAGHTISATFVKKTFSITASAGTGGSISPSGTSTVTYGSSLSYTITPNEGYEIQSVVVDGTNVGKVSTYTFSNVKGGHTISVTFVKKTFSISASAGTGGSISPSGTSSVSYGSSLSYTITPGEGYEIQSVVVDGANVGKVSSYTFSNVKSAHTISVSFVKKTYNITASADRGGSISPSGTVQVTHGESRSFSILPDWGYKVKSVIVDGVDKGAIGGYSFSYVTGPHTISVIFEPSGKIELDEPSVTDDTGVETDGSGIKSGYGIFASVDVTYSGVTDVKLTMTYDFGFGMQTVVLEETGRFVFEYPVNSQSPLGKRCVYIPVETLDGTYTLTFTLTAKNVEGEVLTETSTATVVVRGNMYEDDFSATRS